MKYIAHRGCADQFPENTLQAIRSVAEYVDRIELDVFQCGSGDVILFHDEMTGTLTDENYPVAETDYSTLQDLGVLGTDEHIPLLSEALNAIPPSIEIQLDLKQPGISQAVHQVTEQYNHDLYLCSTDADVLSEASARSWDARPGYVSFAYFQYEDIDPTSITESEWRAAVNIATDMDCTFLEVPFELCYQTNIVSVAQNENLDVVAWTIRTRDQLETVEREGVDAVMIDRIDIL